MKALGYIFIFLCFFPYIDIINIGTDTQPNALVVAALLLFAIPNKKLNWSILILWILFACSIILAFFSTLSVFDTIKNILNYMSPALIAMAGYNVFKRYKLELPFGLFLTVVLTYFIVGFIQMYIDPGFMTSVLNQGARGIMLAGRGVVSLCPEPAFYGSLCLFFIVFSLIMYKPGQNMIAVPILLVQLIIFSQSATSIFVLIVASLMFLAIQLLRFRLRYILVSLVLFFGIIVLFNQARERLEESRAAILIEEIAKNPSLIAQLDVSAGVRITSTISPYLSARHNAFLPMGMGRYKDFIRQLYQEGAYPGLLNKYIVIEIGRLGGGINMILFHLGFIGLLFPLAIYLAFRKNLNRQNGVYAFLLFLVLLCTQIQLMQAMIGLILAVAMYKRIPGVDEGKFNDRQAV